MKALFSILLAAMAIASATGAETQRQWWVTLELGSPISTKYRIKIYVTGEFSVSRMKTDETTFASLATGKLTANEVSRIVRAVRTQIEEFSFPEDDHEERFDGTNIELRLSSKFSDASVGVRAVHSYKDGGSAVVLIVNTINSKTPESARVR